MSSDVRPSSPSSKPAPEPRPPHFVEQIIDADNAAKKWGVWPSGERAGTPKVQTRFPPEPNGYLHIGHAKSICLNYGLAAKYAGKFNLRFDDTNPAKEEQEYVDSIQRDVKWITSAFGGSYDTGPNAGGVFFASNYFQTMYDYAMELINKGKAYVCELSAEEVSKRRGTPQIPATSPFRDRPAAESLKLLDEMRSGKHADGSMTLRAKIDLASPNFNLRDPVLYRILHEHHHNTGDAWCIYPMYDWAHGFEDSLENITHSICTLEFENHRPLYDWFIDSVNEGRPPEKRIWHSQQIEFAKLQLTYTVLSKRNLLKMVEEKIVAGWDDPRMPTIAGFRRRGYTPQAVRAFCEDVGVTKFDSLIDIGRLENACRDHLNKVAPRAMCVLRPLEVVIENWPTDASGKPVVEELDFVINPEEYERAREAGLATHGATRTIPFSGRFYIEQEDFMEVPPPPPAKKFFRLTPGQEVRLRWAYFVKCTGVEKDASGNVVRVRCTYDPATRGGDAPPGPNGEPGRKVKGTLHWVSATHAFDATVRLFDRLFKAEEPGKATGSWVDDLNPHSLETITAKIDPGLAGAKVGETFQFERLGYFRVDEESTPGVMVFNRTVSLKDGWAK
jgi:glutaminyl-tRNA synthetase